MEEQELVICDSDVLIEFLDKGNKNVQAKLIALGIENLCICSITYSEIIIGSLNKAHQKLLLRSLNKFGILEINPEIDFIHRGLIERYTLSHKLSIQDSFIAATALHYNYPLYTLNRKDFSFIEGLNLI